MVPPSSPWLEVAIYPCLEEWRTVARGLLRYHVLPSQVVWTERRDFSSPRPSASLEPPARIPLAFLEIAAFVSCHAHPFRWALLYLVLYRLTHGEEHLLDSYSEPAVRALLRMEKSVRRDLHRLIACVHFRPLKEGSQEHHVAWHRPEHHIIEQASHLLVRRNPEQRWALFTPERSAFWDGELLTFGPGVPRTRAPEPGQLEVLWRSYRAGALSQEGLRAMPESKRIDHLLHGRAAAKPLTAEPFLPKTRSLPSLAQASRDCQGCPLYQNATQTVFGEGPPQARVVMVGEQPGDQEDLGGHPFIGPAGRLLDRALADAGLDRAGIYVTNAVKHFKFVERGKRRIHQKPRQIEIDACRPWLEAEIAAVAPEIIVCLGATAAQTLAGTKFRVTKERGVFHPHPWAKFLVATVHPSALLRVPDPETRHVEYERFVEDLRRVAAKLKTG